MSPWPLPVLACMTLAALLLLGERPGNARMKWLFKPLTSALFLLTAFVQQPGTRYDWLMVGGLALSLVGDVSLIPASRRWFLAGLVAFLLGHVAYVAAFSQRAELLALHPAALGAIGALSLALFLYFRPHLGPLLWPVVAYIVVITLMLIGAWAVWTASDGNAFGWRVAAGATLFYLSDITVARDRFTPGAGFANRALGLPLYYAGQFLLAFSVGS